MMILTGPQMQRLSAEIMGLEWTTYRLVSVMNAVGAALWTLFLIAIFAVLGRFVGAEYNAFQQTGLPDWFSQFGGDEVTCNQIAGPASCHGAPPVPVHN